MKYLAVLSLFCALSGNPRGATETFFPAGESGTGAYLAPALRFNSANEQFGVWLGGRAGFVTNAILSYGLEAYGLVTQVEGDRPAGERIHAGVAGGYLEAVFHPQRKVHTTLGILVGAGSAVAERASRISQDDAVDNSFFVMEPEFSVEYNISHNIRFAPGLSYRWISGTVTPLNSKWELSETSLNFRVKFGNFEGRPRDDW